MQDLIKKYNVPVPRYTSYPTVPFWKEQPMDLDLWCEHVSKSFHGTNSSEGISMYIHLPFCERLCTYCGCNKRITKNHQVEEPYMASLLFEWRQYLTLFHQRPIIREIHLGGGTPTFFSPQNLHKLISSILDDCSLHPNYQFGFEGNPVNTSEQHLKVLFSLGFRRLSLGVQDFNSKVQQAVNRVHDFKQVEKVLAHARNIGYDSINFDLIYGLPIQTRDSIRKTFELVGKLSPDRIAYYSYAHVPWISPSQRGYSEDDLPKETEKRQLYEIGKDILIERGYIDIGMDHFAREDDAIGRAFKNNTLHRNFMGYTENHTDLLIGLGVSAISDCGSAYAQNAKVVEQYQRQIKKDGLSIYRGHFLSDNDRATRDIILKIICSGQVGLKSGMLQNLPKEKQLALKTMQDEDLVEMKESQLKVTHKGKPFIRNICSLFDTYGTHSTDKQIFSKAI